MKKHSDLGLLILAGGFSRRFDGNKALYKIKGKPLIQHVVEKISSLSEEIIISCRTNCQKLNDIFPEAKIVRDSQTIDGPLVGLLSSLSSVKSKYIAVISCDCPKIKPEVIEFLYKKARKHSAAVPKWPNGYIEPLIAVYNTGELEEAVRKAWRDDKMKISKSLEKLNNPVFVSTEEIKKVDSELESFLNLNTPEKVESIFGNGKR